MRILAVIALFCCSLARAQWQDQFAGLWFNPDQPGWGLSVQQQGDVLTLTLLTYGPGGTRWYYARDVRLPAYDYYGSLEFDLTNTTSVQGDLFEEQAGGASKHAGSIALTLAASAGVLKYNLGGTWIEQRIVRATFAPTDPSGVFEGMRTVNAGGSCNATRAPQPIRISVSRTGDVTRLQFTDATGVCDVEATYHEAGPVTYIEGNGRGRCMGLSDSYGLRFEAQGVRVQRDSIGFGYWFGDADCGQYGQINAARVNASPAGSAIAHDDMSGYWQQLPFPSNKPQPGWSITAHQQGNLMFAMVLVPGDGGKTAWYVASNMAYVDGDEYVTHRGELWETEAPPPLRGRRVGSIEITASAAEGGIARIEIDGVVREAYIARATHPSEARIAGSWSGVRTDMLSATPTATAVTWNIEQQSIEVRMKLAEEARTCNIVGALQWRGLTGEIDGSASCDGAANATHFRAYDVRIDDHGLAMRYSFGSESGLIVAVPR